MRRSATQWAWCLTLLPLACSGGEDQPPAETLVETIADMPEAASFSVASTLAVEGAIEAIGATADQSPVLSADGRIFELSAGELVWRPLFSQTGDDLALGAIGAIAPRLAGGAWIAGGDALFVLDDLYVLPSPLVLEQGAIHTITEVASGPLAGLWIGTDDGLFRRTDDAVEAWTIPNASGPVTAVAFERTGRFGAVVIGGAFVTLESSAGAIVTDRGVVDVGTARAVAGTTGAVWVAGSSGVVRFSSDETPPYRKYTFGGSSNAHAIATDPVTGIAWARTADALVEIDGATLRAFALTMPADQTPALAIDMLGDVFSAAEGALARNGTGAAGAGISFEADVRPWIQTNCSQCHMNQTQNFEDYEVFEKLAESALSRVRTGDMPRCDGGVRCDDAENLLPEEYSVLEQWLRDGKME